MSTRLKHLEHYWMCQPNKQDIVTIDQVEFVNPTAAARMMGVSADAVRYWLRTEKVAGVKLGGRYLVACESLARMRRSIGDPFEAEPVAKQADADYGSSADARMPCAEGEGKQTRVWFEDARAFIRPVVVEPGGKKGGAEDG